MCCWCASLTPVAALIFIFSTVVGVTVNLCTAVTTPVLVIPLLYDSSAAPYSCDLMAFQVWRYTWQC